MAAAWRAEIPGIGQSNGNSQSGLAATGSAEHRWLVDLRLPFQDAGKGQILFAITHWSSDAVLFAGRARSVSF